MAVAPDSSTYRKSAYALITWVAVFIAVAKIVGAENVFAPSRYAPKTEDDYGYDHPNKTSRGWPSSRPEPTMMFSSNDKSRWATIRALVDEGTYIIGHRTNFTDTQGPWDDRGIIFEKKFDSLDKVMDPETGHFYSSKPPLFATLLAGEYWLLKMLFGWSIEHDRWYVMIAILLTINAIPFAIYLILLGRLIEEHGTTDFGRLFAFLVAAFGTLLLTFSNTLNNHLPGAFCVLFALYPLLKKNVGPTHENMGRLFVSGFFAGLAVTFELPSAAFLAALFVPMLWLRPGNALLGFLPGALIPILALLLTNYLAVGTIVPVYAEFGGPWYEYPGSYWAREGTALATGIDFAKETKDVYAFHLLLGHHGWFSLTPAWLLGAVGLLTIAWKSGIEVNCILKREPCKTLWTFPLFGAMSVAVSVVVILFFIWRTNNYGGNTSGPRWLFFLIPMWVLGTMPCVDRLAKFAAGRLLAGLLLGLSVMSVFYPAWNPWRPPWIYILLERHGWISYS